jgi:alginate O-acetyltransferase complex protein AlgI
MLFQTPTFFIFASVVFIVYWLLRNHTKLQNLLILIASYVFYGWWDWRLLALIAATCTCDFISALAIEKFQSVYRRKKILQFSLIFNLGILGFFKYYNFFAGELEQLVMMLGGDPVRLRLNIILPVGVSFYTFQTMSYTIDVYRRKLQPTRDPIAFFAYISFFPQLVAGPIERATHLLPQFLSPRQFAYPIAVHGSRLMLWGFFKKLVVADLCSVVVDQAFQGYEQQQGWVMLGACVAFAFQIYGDFSGYSDIARGLAMLFGFDLMQNFQFPYFSRNPAEFWRRWHISLSTWFRDYVFFPLGGSRVGRLRHALNVIIVFAVSGLWHGANWTFLAWGLLNGLLVLPFAMLQSRRPEGALPETNGQRVVELLHMSSTFLVLCITWILFRAPNVGDAWGFMSRIVVDCVEHPGGCLVAARRFILREPATWAVFALVVSEWLSYRRGFHFDMLPRWIRWNLYLLMSTVVVWLAFYRDADEFIYFQF